MVDQERAPGDESWRVRVLDAEGDVLGAGVLLGGKHVLTCAHVVAGDHVFVDRMGESVGRARVVRSRFVPPMDDRRGDVALLDLDEPVPGVGATLRRAALSWDRAVHAFGFPRGLPDGVWSRATLAGRAGPGGEWLQMNRRTADEHRVAAGFSGGGVVDDADPACAVLGVVVCEYTDEKAGLAWMIPVETILRYVPEVKRWTIGGAAEDEVFSERVDSGVVLVDLARTLTGWLERRGDHDPLMIVVGADREVLRRAVALSSRTTRPAVADAPEGTVPPVGSVDLAVDASGKTVDQLSRRIIDRVGLDVDESSSPSEQVRVSTPPMTVVVDGVDEADEPRALLDEVLRPLVENGTRLLLGFRNESSPALTAARAWESAAMAARVDWLTERTMSLAKWEEMLLPASRLRLRVNAAAAQPDPRPMLDRCERDIVRAERMAGQLRERHEASRLLEAYQKMAAVAGLAEDGALAARYLRAHELVHGPLDDLPAAREAVRDYGTTVRQAMRGERR